MKDEVTATKAYFILRDIQEFFKQDESRYYFNNKGDWSCNLKGNKTSPVRDTSIKWSLHGAISKFCPLSPYDDKCRYYLQEICSLVFRNMYPEYGNIPEATDYLLHEFIENMLLMVKRDARI